MAWGRRRKRKNKLAHLFCPLVTAQNVWWVWEKRAAPAASRWWRPLLHPPHIFVLVYFSLKQHRFPGMTGSGSSSDGSHSRSTPACPFGPLLCCLLRGGNRKICEKVPFSSWHKCKMERLWIDWRDWRLFHSDGSSLFFQTWIQSLQAAVVPCEQSCVTSRSFKIIHTFFSVWQHSHTSRCKCE